MKTALRLALLLVIPLTLLVAVACSSDDSSEGDDAGGDSDTTSSTDGSGGGGDSNGGGNDSDDDAIVEVGDPDAEFPIAIPDGILVDPLAEAGIRMEGGRQLLYAEDDFDRLVAFYDDWTASQDREFAKAIAGDTVTFLSLEGVD
jgi:hypothetical protein